MEGYLHLTSNAALLLATQIELLGWVDGIWYLTNNVGAILENIIQQLEDYLIIYLSIFLNWRHIVDGKASL